MPFLGSVDRSCLGSFLLKEDDLQLHCGLDSLLLGQGKVFPTQPEGVSSFSFIHPFRSQHIGSVLAGSD